MTQALIYSINAEHLANILNGLKTIEVRKRDLPQWAKDKLARGEIVEGYGYCTKAEPELLKIGGSTYKLSQCNCNAFNKLNSLVVVKFEVSGTTRYVDCSGCTNTENGYECENDFMYLLSVDPILRKATCLEADEIEAYGNGADIYAHHITNIQPVHMELGEFHYFNKEQFNHYNTCINENWDTKYLLQRTQLRRAPQSFQSAWVKGE